MQKDVRQKVVKLVRIIIGYPALEFRAPIFFSKSCKEQKMSLHSLVVHNFKSYDGEHTIGPFKTFTAIIGPNGSGE